MPFIVAVVIPLLTGAAIGLLLWGWHGRRIDDHPLCHRCGFDLTGKPDTSTACPECGADLSHPRATRHGHRARRSWAVAMGGSILATLLLAGVVATVVVVRKVDLYPYKPLALLTRELPTSTWAEALAEIRSRQSAGKLSRADQLNVADRLLARQADLKQTWLPTMGDFIESLHADGILDEGRYRQFASQSLQLSAELTDKLFLAAGGGETKIRVQLYFDQRSSVFANSRWQVDIETLCQPIATESGEAPLSFRLNNVPHRLMSFATIAKLGIPPSLAAAPDGMKFPARVTVKWRLHPALPDAAVVTSERVLASGSISSNHTFELYLRHPASRASSAR